MNGKDLATLVVLGALWGGSFIFMRIAAPEFGPIPLVAVRIAIGALCLAPFLATNDGLAELRANWGHTLVLGLLNSALPFALLSFAVLSLTAGFAGIINASAPLWGGLIAVIWLLDKLNLSRVLGLFIGFGGVVLLVWDSSGTGATGSQLAISASLLGAFSYGLAANYAKRYLAHVNAITVATGSLVGAALFLLPAAVWLWPEEPISANAWLSLLVMGVASTAMANILYFRLIARSGPTVAISVAFLIPLFAMVFGVLFLDEVITARMLAGCAVILLGTAMVARLIQIPGKRAGT